MKATIFSIILAAILIGGVIVFTPNSGGPNTNSLQNENNVSIIDGKQIIEISARGGYFPRVTEAKAGVPTVLRVNTRGTFDCSSALTIPALSYRANLPYSGTTEVEVPAQEVGAKLQGLCAMGMYNFLINFN